MLAVVLVLYAAACIAVVVGMFLVLGKFWGAFAIAVSAEPTPATSATSIGLALVLIAGAVFLEPFVSGFVPPVGVVFVALPWAAVAVAVVRAFSRSITDPARRHRMLVVAGGVGAAAGVVFAVVGLPAWRSHERSGPDAAGSERATGVESRSPSRDREEPAPGPAPHVTTAPVSLGTLLACPCALPSPCTADHVWLSEERTWPEFCVTLVPASGLPHEPVFVHVEHEVEREFGLGWALLGSHPMGPFWDPTAVTISLPYRPDRHLRIVVRTASRRASATTEIPAP